MNMKKIPQEKNTYATTNTNLNFPKRKVVAVPVKKVDVQNGHSQRVTINCLEDSGSQVGDKNVKLNLDVKFSVHTNQR